MKIFIFKRKFILSFTMILAIAITYFCISSYELKSVTVNSTPKPELQKKLDSIFDSNEKVAYLTFDDGPTKKATPKILDILKKENIKATFFVIGKYVKNHPDIVKRAYDEGHFIANHRLQP